MNRRLRLAVPKQTLAQRSGSAMKPIGLPVGSKIFTPSCWALPMPHPHHRLPSTSRRKPSGVPPASADDERASVADLLTIDVVDADHARGHAGLDDVKLLLVGREGKPVGPIDLVGHHRHGPGLV